MKLCCERATVYRGDIVTPSRLLKESSQPAPPSVFSPASRRELSHPHPGPLPQPSGRGRQRKGATYGRKPVLSQGAETFFIRKWVFPHPARRASASPSAAVNRSSTVAGL